MKLTHNQQKFLDIHQANVLVSASAGCGKTTTMIQKLIHLILHEHVKVCELLVVTFTNAAGMEMKQKLYKQLYKTILEQSLTIDEKNELTEELEDIGQADIGTLHGFCKKIIDQYFYVIDLDPKFVILEENEQQYLLLKSVSKVLNEYSKEKDEAFRNLFEYFNKSRHSNNFTQSLLFLHSYLSSKADKLDWKKEKQELVKKGEYIGEQVVTFLFTYFKQKFQALEESVRLLIEESKRYDLEKYTLSLQEINNLLTSINATTTIWEMDKLCSSKGALIKVRRTKNILPEYLDFVDRYDALFGENKPSWDSVRGVLNAYKKYVQLDEGELDQTQIENRILQVIPHIEKLFEVEERISRKYDSLKRDYNGLDFNDLEQKTLLILQNSQIRKEITKKYKAIFVDEYQDISDAQEKIIASIHTSAPLYMIGDVKQSIYAFRHCTPAIFLQKVQDFSLDGKENILLGLNDNFRSNDNILQWVNFVCGQLITKQTMGLDYQSTSLLKCGNENQKVANTNNVTLQIVPNLDSDDIGGIRAQAYAILTTITKNLGKEYFNIAKGTTEKLTYRDFAILTHNKGKLVEEIYNLLTENDIPVSASFNSNLFHTEEIGTLVAILKVLNNMQNEEAMTILLLSPIGRLSEQELVKIKRKDTSFSQDILDYDGQDEIKEKITKCFTFIKKYRAYLEHHSVVDTLKEIIFEYDLMNYYGTLPDGIGRVNRITLFLSLISSESLKYSLKQVLEYIEELSKKENFEITVSAGENAVQIMTMHKSKGLEFPFVILAGLSTQFNEEILRQDVVISDRFGIGMRSRDIVKRIEQNNLLRSACILDKLEEEKKEEIRLLYVAMTRAKNFLHMIGYQKEEKSISKHPLLCRSHFEMIWSTIPLSIQEAMFQNKKGVSSLGESKLHYIMGLDQEEVQLKEQTKPLLCAYSTKEYEKIRELIDKNEHIVASVPIALKNTVSEMLMKEDEDYVNLVDSPQNFALIEQTFSTISASDIGTAYHKIMEQMNFDFSQNAQSVVDELFQKGILPISLKNKINIAKINHAMITISQFVSHHAEVFKEVQFMYKDKHKNLVKNSDIEDEILIQGMVDLFIKCGNKGVLLDYKTNKNMTEKEFIEKYQKQLELYALALREAYHLEELTSYIYSFELEKLIKIPS